MCVLIVENLVPVRALVRMFTCARQALVAPITNARQQQGTASSPSSRMGIAEEVYVSVIAYSIEVRTYEYKCLLFVADVCV